MNFKSVFASAYTALIVLTFGASDVVAQVQCRMPVAERHEDPDRTAIRATTGGEKALFFTSDLDVNTDGAARSYHPDDPRGRTLALNNMGNAITRLIDADGRTEACSPRRGACFTRFIQGFEQARDAGYAPSGAPRVETTGIIPWQLDPATGRQAPCTIADGPHRGFFVSQTALAADRSRAICDPERYLDALAFNAIVLPRRAAWSSQGVVADGGDLAVVLDGTTGIHAFALVGDRGPQRSIGEGTVALAAALGGASVAPDATFEDIKRLKRATTHTVVFPTRDVPRLTGGRFTQDDIDRLGAEALEAFGGLARLQACAANPGG